MHAPPTDLMPEWQTTLGIIFEAMAEAALADVEDEVEGACCAEAQAFDRTVSSFDCTSRPEFKPAVRAERID